MAKHKFDADTAHNLSEVMRSFSRIKTVSAKITRSPTDGSGRFVALVSTFGPPPDADGDIISEGAFDRTITDAYVNHPDALWSVWWQHGYDDPDNAIGVITGATETERGLVVEGRLAIDTNEKAMSVYRGMLEDRIREWSIGYGVVEQHRGEWNGVQVNFLDQLELLEISAAYAGANRYTETLAVKSDPDRRVKVNIGGEMIEVDVKIAEWLAEDTEPVSIKAKADVEHWNCLIDDAAAGKNVERPAVDVDAFIAESREIRARERGDAAKAQRAGTQAAAGDQVTTDNTSGEQFFRMLFPATVRKQRDEGGGQGV